MSTIELKLDDLNFKTVICHVDLSLLTDEIKYIGNQTFLFQLNEDGTFGYDFSKDYGFIRQVDYFRFQFGMAYLIGLFQMRYLAIISEEFQTTLHEHQQLQIKASNMELLYNDLKSRVDPDILSEHIAGAGRTANKKKLH